MGAREIGAKGVAIPLRQHDAPEVLVRLRIGVPAQLLAGTHRLGREAEVPRRVRRHAGGDDELRPAPGACPGPIDHLAHLIIVERVALALVRRLVGLAVDHLIEADRTIKSRGAGEFGERGINDRGVVTAGLQILRQRVAQAPGRELRRKVAHVAEHGRGQAGERREIREPRAAAERLDAHGVDAPVKRLEERFRLLGKDKLRVHPGRHHGLVEKQHDVRGRSLGPAGDRLDTLRQRGLRAHLEIPALAHKLGHIPQRRDEG